MLDLIDLLSVSEFYVKKLFSSILLSHFNNNFSEKHYCLIHKKLILSKHIEKAGIAQW